MAIQLDKFLSEPNIQIFNQVGVENLLAGTNLQHNDKVYNVRMIQTPPDPRSNMTEELVLRMHNEQLIAFFSIEGTKEPNKLKPHVLIPKDTGVNEPYPDLYRLFQKGVAVNQEMAPKLQRPLSQKETDIFNTHPELMPILKVKKPQTETNIFEQHSEPKQAPEDPEPLKIGADSENPIETESAGVDPKEIGNKDRDEPEPPGNGIWSRNQKITLFFLAAFALTAASYAAFRMRKGGVPKPPVNDLPNPNVNPSIKA